MPKRLCLFKTLLLCGNAYARAAMRVRHVCAPAPARHAQKQRKQETSSVRVQQPVRMLALRYVMRAPARAHALRMSRTIYVRINVHACHGGMYAYINGTAAVRKAYAQRCGAQRACMSCPYIKRLCAETRAHAMRRRARSNARNVAWYNVYYYARAVLPRAVRARAKARSVARQANARREQRKTMLCCRALRATSA